MIYKKNFKSIEREIRTASREAAKETAEAATDLIAQSFAEDKSGEIYDYGQASAAGESPAIAEGDLLASLKVERSGQTGYKFGATDEKAEMLEFGTSRMEPRPFIAPIEKKVQTILRKKSKEKLGSIR